MPISQNHQKTCSICHGSGPFGISKTGKDGLKSHCRKCCADRQREYRERNPDVWFKWAAANAEHLKAKDAQRYRADPEAEKNRVRVYQAKNPAKRAHWEDVTKLKKYGLTPQDRDALLSRQGGLCAICSVTLTRGRTKTGMQVDHDHDTGKVRGLLCLGCNVLLGDFRNTPAFIERAISYLGRGLLTLPPGKRPPEAGKSSTRAANLWYKYGLSDGMIKVILKQQRGSCAICQEKLTLKRVHVDHDHDHPLGPKAIRGMLCRSCNFGIGHAGNSVTVLRQAMTYLTVSCGVSFYTEPYIDTRASFLQSSESRLSLPGTNFARGLAMGDQA